MDSSGERARMSRYLSSASATSVALDPNMNAMRNLVVFWMPVVSAGCASNTIFQLGNSMASYGGGGEKRGGVKS